MKGMLIDTCKMIAEETGLRFQFEALPSDKKRFGDREYPFYICQGEPLNDNDHYYTQSLFDSVFYMYAKSGVSKNIDRNVRCTVAIPDNRNYFYTYFSCYYPEVKLVEADGPQDCIRLLQQDKVDFAFLNMSVWSGYVY